MQVAKKPDDALDEPHKVRNNPPKGAEQVDVPEKHQNESDNGAVEGSVPAKSSHDDGKAGRSGTSRSFVRLEGVDTFVSLD